MAEDTLPTFEDGKIYLIKGKSMNAIMNAMVRKIIVDTTIFAFDKKGGGSWELKFVGPDEDDYVLTRQGGVMSWAKIEDC